MFTLLPAALDSHLQREAGMSHFEFSVMGSLSREPGRRLQLKDLAVVANGSLSRLSHVKPSRGGHESARSTTRANVFCGCHDDHGGMGLSGRVESNVRQRKG
jgi:hypothetical protein